tara:strand:- start:269 stop:988 length:720 start_codon:yes stop_codon:yes gene_type:complete
VPIRTISSRAIADLAVSAADIAAGTITQDKLSANFNKNIFDSSTLLSLQNDSIILNGTDGASANAGDNIVFDTAADVNDRVLVDGANAEAAGKVLSTKIVQINENSTRSSATSFADDLDFGSFTPTSSNSIVLIQATALFDGTNSSSYQYYKWVINGVEFLSTGDSTPIASHIQYNIHTNNNLGVIPSTIMTSVTNTDGSAITVKCQGKVSTGTLYINRSNNADQAGCPSSCIWTEVAV